MTIKTYFTITSVIGIIFGIGFLLIPEQLALIYAPTSGYKEPPDTMLAHRLFGGALLAWALVGWFAKDFRDLTAVRGCLIAAAVGHTAGFLVTASAILSGVINALGWPNALVYLFGAIGAVYFLMSRSQNS